MALVDVAMPMLAARVRIALGSVRWGVTPAALLIRDANFPTCRVTPVTGMCRCDTDSDHQRDPCNDMDHALFHWVDLTF
ncbi:MAG: hypothetical protein ACFCUG_13150 [Thiotrichales bacterium]